MVTNQPSFNFNFDSFDAEEDNVEELLDVSTLEVGKIAEMLETGQGMLLKEADIQREILPCEKFLTSYSNFSDMFTNHVDLKCLEKHITENLEHLKENIDFVTKNTDHVEFDTTHTRRLSNLLNFYGVEDKEEYLKEEKLLFKVPGITTYRKNHKGEKRKENAFRVYLGIENKANEYTIYKLFFCDIYHLAIPSGHNGQSRETHQMQIFNQRKYLKGHLREIF